MKDERSVEIRVNKYWSRGKCVLQGLECLFLFAGPLVGDSLFQQVIEWCGFLGEVSDELAVIGSQSKKAPQDMNRSRMLKVLDFRYLVGIQCKTIGRDHMAKKLQLLSDELTLFLVTPQVGFPQLVEDPL